VRLGNYSKVHQGEYYIITGEKQDNILDLDDVKEYIETRLAINTEDFSKIRYGLESFY
jgi:hypothetical protein